LKELLEPHLHENHYDDDFEITQGLSGLGQRTLLLDARRLVSDGETSQLILLAIEDVSGRRGDNTARAEGRDRYQTLLESIDEGFRVIEIIFDQRGKPVDCRFLEVNPTFLRHTGLQNAIGKRIWSLVPEIEEHWIGIHGAAICASASSLRNCVPGV